MGDRPSSLARRELLAPLEPLFVLKAPKHALHSASDQLHLRAHLGQVIEIQNVLVI